MNVLVGKTFGIGNAVMAVPMIKAFQSMSGTVVDVLVGNLPDDVGAYQVLSKVVRPPGKIHIGTALERHYDLAVMAIPFDGRWVNGRHFQAYEVMDGRTRPDPTTTGLVSWKKHEVEYQMDNARERGYTGIDPSCSFLDPSFASFDRIYLGLGYKKDAAGFWKVKHWGNENYAKLVSLLLKRYPEKKIITSGDFSDLRLSILPIEREVNDPRFVKEQSYNVDRAFEIVSSCGLYVGNDTGMMHVAASCGRKVIGMFFLENSIVKSRPWCDDYRALDGSVVRNSVTPEYVMGMVEEMYD